MSALIKTSDSPWNYSLGYCYINIKKDLYLLTNHNREFKSAVIEVFLVQCFLLVSLAARAFIYYRIRAR